MESRGLPLLFVLLSVCWAVVQPGLAISSTALTSGQPALIQVNLTNAAKTKGAVCLDGSPAMYYYIPGNGNGSNNWVIWHEGGAWCYDVKSCAERAGTYLGSSSVPDPEGDHYKGMMSGVPETNPDLYNWNRVFVRYCDGASFSGDVESPVEIHPGGQKLYFRGQRIWEAVITDLLENRGMDKAEKALLTGCSAGGLTALIHCDQFRAIMPVSTHVKCLSDAGFFLDRANVDGNYVLRSQMQSTLALQNATVNLHPDCTASRDASEMWQCIFPQYFIQYVKTPLYILNSGYDSWQIYHSLLASQNLKGRKGSWRNCAMDFSTCSKDQFDFIQGFRNEMASILSKVMQESLPQSGVYIVSCRIHCISRDWGYQHSPGRAMKFATATLANVIGDWYFDRNQIDPVQIDPALPPNSNCLRN